MIDLTKTTFIIPFKADSADRFNNADTVLSYLNQHFQTNVFIYEMVEPGCFESTLDFLGQFKNLKIKFYLETSTKPYFHRTRILNQMLRDVETEIVCNYDIDVMLEPYVYALAQNEILSGRVDVIYPYGEGWYQKQILKTYSHDTFRHNHFDITKIATEHLKTHTSVCGHCFFIRTKDYRDVGGECEEFLSWGPEDKERYRRFLMLRKVGRIPAFVYHWEHDRNADSGETNPCLIANEQLWQRFQTMDRQQIMSYYEKL